MANTYEVLDLHTGTEVGAYRSDDAFWAAELYVDHTGHSVAVLDATTATGS